MYSIVIPSSVSCPKVDSIADGHDEEKSKMLKRFICEYFAQNNSLAPADWKNDVSVALTLPFKSRCSQVIN